VSAAIVTGAANGIGAACAHAFADAGWDLVLVDRDEAALARVAEGVGGRVAGGVAGRVETVAGDVSVRAVNDAAVALAEDRLGGLGAVVANAGVNLARSLDDTTDEDIDRLLSVNLRAVVYLAQAAHSALARSAGSLIVMASKTGLVAQRDSPIYCATKGAAIQLARALALDWAPEGIRVNAVCPGIVDTPMLESFFEQLPHPDRAREESATAQPLGRLARPEECAAAALFLASRGASFITGVALPVDGGFTAQ
jgi:NAD(P)-dependent dehydrogenase (short-subunit alcohol dehydrogenase family)